MKKHAWNKSQAKRAYERLMAKADRTGDAGAERDAHSIRDAWERDYEDARARAS